MRDLFVLATMLAVVPLAMSNAFIAYLLWGWAGLVALQTFMFGFMAGVPFVQVFAVLALLLLFFRRDIQTLEFKPSKTIILFAVFVVHAALVALFAYADLPRNVEIFTNICKTVLFCALMPMLVTSRWRMHVLLTAIVIALSFHGFMDGLKFLASGGAHISRGIAKFGDNNHFALALAMVVPLQLYLYRYSKGALAKLGFASAALLTVCAVIATHSRGGLLTLFAVAAWQVWYSKRKVMGLVALVGCISVVLLLAPESWTERMDTIKNAEDDSSFMGRVAVWKKSSAIALEHPMLGGGFYAVQAPATFEKFRYSQGLLGFINTGDPGRHAAHSIYFQVMGDSGFLGLLIYMALLLNVYHTRMHVKRLALAQGTQSAWASDLADALGASLLAFMVGGAALSAAYFELPFLIMALMQTIKHWLDSESLKVKVTAK